jgi:hypothetical protein
MAMGEEDAGHLQGNNAPLLEGGIDLPRLPRDAGIDQEIALFCPY